MCYSAIVWTNFRKYQRHGGKLVIADFEKLYFYDEYKERRKKHRTPKGLDDAFDESTPTVRAMIDQWQAEERTALEQEIFKQKKRLADAERTLLTKTTKKALEDQRISTDKISKALLRLSDISRKEPKDRDNRMFPHWYVPILIVENGERVIKPMRYGCRIAGMPASSDFTRDRQMSGTYNARRDNLERFWRRQFGHSHGLMVVNTFYENVEGEDGKNRVLQFTPKNREPMLVACLWSHWTDPSGVEPDLLSFAAITDEPEPEVAAAGHDRTIINIKPEHVDAWLNPNGDLQRMYAIFDDKQHPFYEHQVERAA